MKRLFGLIILIILISSCATRKRCNRKFPPEIIVKDSIHVQTQIEYRDTTIFAPADTVTLTDTIECDELGRINLPEREIKSNQARVKVSIENNRLQVEAHCDSLELQLEKVREIHKKEISSMRNETHIRRERYIPGFYQFTYWYFLLTAGVGLLYFLLRKKIG